MCEWKSGIAVKLNRDEVVVKTLYLNDSHTVIREKHGIKENEGGLSDRSTPVELLPKTFPPKSFKAKDWDFHFDADRPDWWTDSMTQQATAQLLAAAKVDWENDNEEEQLEAVKNGGHSFVHVKNPSLTVQLAMVKKNGFNIQLIKNPSPAVQLAAVNETGWAIGSIKKPSLKVQLAAVKENGHSIQHIKRPSEAVQLAAVKRYGVAIQHIKRPSEKVQLAAVNRNTRAFCHIKKPTPAVIKVAGA